MVVRLADIRALLAAYDALRAERDQAVKGAELLHAHMKAMEIDLEMAKAAQAQAAPVLAAADQWADELPMETGEAGLHLMSVVLAWRATREG